MVVGLAKGVWYNGVNALITGAGVVVAANASGPVLYLGYAMIGLGALQFAWGITHTGEHWWKRDRIRVTWPYALMIVSAIGFTIGAVAAFRAKAVLTKVHPNEGHKSTVVAPPAPSPSSPPPHVSYSPPTSRAFRKGLDDYVGEIARPQSPSREKFTVPLKGFYSSGTTLKMRLQAVSDDSAAKELDKMWGWYTETGLWICQNMGDFALSKFTDLPVDLEPHGPRGKGVAAAKLLSGSLDNLSLLIRSDDWDPRGKVVMPPEGCEAKVGKPTDPPFTGQHDAR